MILHVTTEPEKFLCVVLGVDYNALNVAEVSLCLRLGFLQFV